MVGIMSGTASRHMLKWPSWVGILFALLTGVDFDFICFADPLLSFISLGIRVRSDSARLKLRWLPTLCSA